MGWATGHAVSMRAVLAVPSILVEKFGAEIDRSIVAPAHFLP